MKFKFPSIPKTVAKKTKKNKTQIVEDPALIGMKEKNHYLMTTK
jgi:hypothetical protein